MTDRFMALIGHEKTGKTGFSWPTEIQEEEE